MNDQQKIEVLEFTKTLLKDETQYRKDVSFEETCNNTPPYTFSCALRAAHIHVMGVYDNRSQVMNLLRLIIYWNYFWRTGIHPIYSFGKHKKTILADVHNVINIAINRIKN